MVSNKHCVRLYSYCLKGIY
uniref:Uncharacterized protein n=1 Tax=Anguilla anguilla TaxID=7936 RepID=A0A0E9SWY5_ANGAN